MTVRLNFSVLQGTRMTVTGENGGFIFQALPQGRYLVTMELEGMGQIERNVQVNLAETARVDAEMQVAAVVVVITVMEQRDRSLFWKPLQIEDIEMRRTLDNVPINRTITGAVTLAPGVSTEGPTIPA